MVKAVSQGIGADSNKEMMRSAKKLRCRMRERRTTLRKDNPELPAEALGVCVGGGGVRVMNFLELDLEVYLM